MGLTAEQHKFRENKVTASFAPYLMSGNEEKMLNEWRRIVGDPNYVPDDLADSWPVQFGSYIENFAIDWHQKKTGKSLIMRGASINHPQKKYVCATLDCYRKEDQTVIDCKAPGMFRKLDDVLSFYPAQLVVQRGCMNANNQSLLVVHGGSEPVEHAIPLTEEYIQEVWERMDWFWGCCENLTPPAALPSVAAPVAPEKFRDIDFTGNNEFSFHAAEWIESKAAAGAFDVATKALKKLVPEDCGKAFGYNVQIKRNKAGSLSITEVKS